MIWFAVFFSAVAAGFIQSVTGFGSAVMMLLGISYFFDMLHAPAVVSVVALSLSAGLAWRFRKQVDYRQTIPVAVIYISVSTVIISFSGALDLNVLSLAFGLFLVALSLYYLLLSKSLAFHPGPICTVLCAASAGVSGGLFGVGGPLVAIYFLASAKSKESYVANLQFLFLITNTVNTIARIYHGIYTVELVPFTLVGIVGIQLGKLAGLRVLDRIDMERMKQSVYIFIGISGVLTVVSHL
ncbi:MAG: sulfite exporter TauE/SafE family protein [Lawsonibacter sp.]